MALVVGQYISKLKGENMVRPLDIFASLTNYSGDGTTSIGVWSVVNVLQNGKLVSFTQREVEDPDMNCSVLCPYRPREVLEEAGMLHWSGRLHNVTDYVGPRLSLCEAMTHGEQFFGNSRWMRLLEYFWAAPRLHAIPTVLFGSLESA